MNLRRLFWIRYLKWILLANSPLRLPIWRMRKQSAINHVSLTIVLEFPHFQEYICQREVGEGSHNGWIWISPGNDQQELIFILFLVGSVLSQNDVFRRQVFLKDEIKDVMSMRLQRQIPRRIIRMVLDLDPLEFIVDQISQVCWVHVPTLPQILNFPPAMNTTISTSGAGSLLILSLSRLSAAEDRSARHGCCTVSGLARRHLQQARAGSAGATDRRAPRERDNRYPPGFLSGAAIPDLPADPAPSQQPQPGSPRSPQRESF